MKKTLLSTFFLAALLTSNAQVTNGLFASYDFNASNSIDAISPKANGTNTNVSYVNDRFNNPGAAAKFNGSSGISFGAPAKALVTTGLTISAWINATAVANQQAIVSKWTNSMNTDQYMLMINAGKIMMGVGKPGQSALGYQSISSINAGVWYHVVATWDTSGTHEIYINNTLDMNVVDPNFKTINSTSGTNLSVGTQNGTMRFMDGVIDDVKLYNRKLNASEISLLYNEINPIVNGLVSKYTFSNQTAEDEVNNNDGTITNANWVTDRLGNQNSALDVLYNSTRMNLNDSYDGFSTGTTGKISYSFWTYFKTVTSTYQMLLMKYADSGCSSNERQFLLRLDPNNKMEISAQGTLGPNNSISYEGNTTIVAGQWYHMVLTYDASITTGNKFSLFIDNTPETLTATSSVGSGIGSGYQDGNACIGVGAYLNASGSVCNNAQRLDAYFDDLYIYNKVLNQFEIDNLYNNITPQVGLSANNNTHNMKLFPNPFSEEIRIEMNSNSETKITLFNLTGQLIQSKSMIGNSTTINTSNLSEGVYFIRIVNDEGITTKKIIKK